MKRNRLVSPSIRKSLFSNTANSFPHRRHIISLSSLAIIGVFITSMVLATNQPSPISSQSTTLDLPDLNAVLAIEAGSTNTIVDAQMAVPTQVANTVTINIPPLSSDSDKAHALELSDSEQQSLAAITANNLSQTSSIQAAINWQDITVKSGDNLSRIFPRVGLSARDVYNIAQLGDDIKPLLNLKPGQVLRFDISEIEGVKSLQQIELKLSPLSTLSIVSSIQGYQTTLSSREVDYQQTHASGIISSSLFGAGITAGLSDKLIMELAYIFGWDIDFALDLRSNDSFTLIYNEEYLDGEKIADGKILAAQFTNQGKTFRAVRYTDDQGNSQYYSPTGDSMRKAFSRTPVHFSRISSKFNPNRKHPILKINRPHRGVDYAAARGTPILATGDGKIDFRGTKGGYGRTIVLSHGGKYTTLYAHMSSFKRGLKRGSRVKQGQTIGFIGSSGTATGPHLHYEFRVNGVHRNPLTVSLPKADALAKKYQQDFDLMSLPLLAQLDRLNNTALAAN